MKYQHYLAAGICGFVLISGLADAAGHKKSNKGKTTESAVALTDAGRALETKYAAMQTALKAEIEAALPKLDDAKIAAWREALNAEEGPAKEAAAKAKEVDKMQAAPGRLQQMEENLKYGLSVLDSNVHDAPEGVCRRTTGTAAQHHIHHVSKQVPKDTDCPLFLHFWARGGRRGMSIFSGRARFGWRTGQAVDKRGKLSLYDLSSDIGETNDVAGEHPDIVAKLSGLMRKAWTEPRSQEGESIYTGREGEH